MKLVLSHLFILCVGVLLTACGSGSGGDGSESAGSNVGSGSAAGSGVSVATASSAYTGLRSAAVLNQQNSETFMQLFFGLRALDDALSVPEVSGLNQTTSCANSGSISLTGSVTLDGKGSIVATFASCNQDDSVIDGVMYVTVNATDGYQDPSDMVISYQGLSVQTAGRSFLMTGVETYLEIDSKTTRSVTNSTIEENGLQMFLENMTVNEVLYSVGQNDDEGELISGRIYLADEGYVDVSTTERIGFDWRDVGGYPVRGQMKMAGDNAANITIQPNGPDNFQAFLDQDGDFMTDLIGTKGSQPMDLVWNSAANASPAGLISAEDGAVFKVNSPILLNGYNSVNHMGEATWMMYEWSIDTDRLPYFGAITSIAATTNSEQEAEFITDTSGDYWIQLEVTDGDGRKNLTTKLITVEN